MLAPQIVPSPQPRNIEAEIIQVPANLNNSSKDGWINNGEINCSLILELFQHKKPSSSVKYALFNQFFLHHSDHLTNAVTKEPLGEQG